MQETPYHLQKPHDPFFRDRNEWHDVGQKKGSRMGRILKALLVLVLLGLVALTGFAYVADLTPAKGEVKVPVTLNAD